MGIEITERKQTEEQLRKSEENFSLVANTIGEVFWIYDNQQRRIEYIADGGNANFIEPAILDYEKMFVPTICLYEVFKRVLHEF